MDFHKCWIGFIFGTPFIIASSFLVPAFVESVISESVSYANAGVFNPTSVTKSRDASGQNPRKFVLDCGYIILPKIYGSMSAAVANVTATLARHKQNAGSSTYKVSEFHCFLSQKWNSGNFKKLEKYASASAVKFKVPEVTDLSKDSHHRRRRGYHTTDSFCNCGYAVFPATHGSMKAAVFNASTAVVQDRSNGEGSPTHSPYDYNYLVSHYNITDYRCFMVQTWYGGNFKELERATYKSALKYRLPKYTNQFPSAYSASNRYPGRFRCLCGYTVFPKTYKSMRTAIAEASYAAIKDLRTSNSAPSGNSSTFKVTDYLCFCTQSWNGNGKNFQILDEEASKNAIKYGVPEATSENGLGLLGKYSVPFYTSSKKFTPPML